MSVLVYCNQFHKSDTISPFLYIERVKSKSRVQNDNYFLIYGFLQSSILCFIYSWMQFSFEIKPRKFPVVMWHNNCVLHNSCSVLYRNKTRLIIFRKWNPIFIFKDFLWVNPLKGRNCYLVFNGKNWVLANILRWTNTTANIFSKIKTVKTKLK